MIENPRDLYDEVILDHSKQPRNFVPLENPSHYADGRNPICVDEISVYLDLNEESLASLTFSGQGCAISKASASMMTESIKGKGKAEAEKIFDAFRQMVTLEPGEDFDPDLLGDLEILSGVSQYPARIKCATLSWHTLRDALRGEQGKDSKE